MDNDFGYYLLSTTYTTYTSLLVLIEYFKITVKVLTASFNVEIFFCTNEHFESVSQNYDFQADIESKVF